MSRGAPGDSAKATVRHDFPRPQSTLNGRTERQRIESVRVPGGAAGEVEHQFLNTGLAVHAAVIRRFLDAEGIEYRSEG